MHQFQLTPEAIIPEEGGYQILSGLSRQFPFIHGRPYAEGDWEVQYAEWLDWLRTLEGRNLSQADLDEAFQAYVAGQPDDEGRATHPKLIDTERLSVRDSDVTVSVLLPEDVRAIDAEVAAGATGAGVRTAHRVVVQPPGGIGGVRTGLPREARASRVGPVGRGLRSAIGVVPGWWSDMIRAGVPRTWRKPCPTSTPTP